MKKTVGVWIDHRKAVIVTATADTETVTRIVSSVEKQLRRSGDSPLHGAHESQHVPADDSRERKFKGQLNGYYDSVVESIRGAVAILILGPGEAKTEFKKRMEHEGLAGRIVGMETVGRMTDRQLAARVRQCFPQGEGAHA